MAAFVRGVVILAAIAGAVAITPDLHPKSDAKFFDKDYPEDTRPVVSKDHFGFKHPYPIVQETNDYDKDYVKDENGDGGEWKAQTEYDSIRNKIPHQQEAVKKALLEEQGEEKGYDVAIKLEYDSDASVKDLKKQLEEMKKARAAADERLAKAEKAAADAEKAGKDKTDADGKDIDAAKGEVAKDKAEAAEAGKAGKDGKGGAGGAEGEGGDAGGAGGDAEVLDKEELLKKCKEELEKSKRKLDKLKWDAAEHAKQLEAERQGLEYKKKEFDGMKVSAEGLEVSTKGAYDKLMKEKDLADLENGIALKSVEQEKADVKKVEAELDEAAETLRSFRKQEAGSGGGIYHKPKPIAPTQSGSAMLYPSALAGLAALAMF